MTKTKQLLTTLIAGGMLFVNLQCYNGSVLNADDNNPLQHQTISLDLFPFENTTNWWKYSDGHGYTVSISVIDTITDNDTLFYKVKFEEMGFDTTDDWFGKFGNGVEFGVSLRQPFHTFIPRPLSKPSGSFTSSTGSVSYTYYDTLTSDSTIFSNAVVFQYGAPVLHGFDEIIFADSIGIISMTDFDSRRPIVYTLDSCSINSEIRKF